jgi:hypothetical protein
MFSFSGIVEQKSDRISLILSEDIFLYISGCEQVIYRKAEKKDALCVSQSPSPKTEITETPVQTYY